MDTIVVVGGQEDDKVSRACWKVDQPDEIVHLFDIPVDDLTTKFSVCAVPQGFIITGYAAKLLCMMFIASTKSWVRLQDLLEYRHGHGSICIMEVLYILGGFLGELANVQSYSKSVNYLLMKEGEWMIGPDIPLNVKFPQVSNINKNVYLLDVDDSKKLCHLNVDDRVWNELAPLPVEGQCFGAKMASAKEMLFVFGGEAMICAWYKPEVDTWCTGQKPLQDHKYGALGYCNGVFLLLGGSFRSGTDEVEEYDIDEDKWTMCNYKMPRKIHLHHAVVLKMQQCD